MSVENKILNNNNSDILKDHSLLKVAHATWTQDDRLLELDDIIEGAAHSAVEIKFKKYVEEIIEPTGWTAIWRAQRDAVISAVKIQNPYDFVVEVVNVKPSSLKASIIIKEVVTNNIDELDLQLEEIIGNEVLVLLLELFPTYSQENETININTTTEVLDHLRFFYQHISLPWDHYEEIVYYNKHVLQTRIKTYEDIQSGVIPKSVALEMESIKEKGRKIGSTIVALEKNVSLSPLKEFDQFHVVRLMKLMKQMDFMKNQYENLKDPVLRELSAHEQQLERKYIMASHLFDEPSAKLLLVASSVDVNLFVQCVAELPSVLKTLPQVLDISKIRTFPSLQVALDSATHADAIALLPGIHYMNDLCELKRGGTILGLGDGVEIMGGVQAGDILMDVEVDPGYFLLLQSVLLKPVVEQSVICIRGGKVLFDRCKVIGGSVGATILNRSECKVKSSTFSNQEKVAFSVADGARLILDGAKIDNCEEAAIQMRDEYSDVTATNGTMIDSCPLGLKLLRYPHGSPDTELKPCPLKSAESIPFIFKNVGEHYKHFVTMT